MKKLVVPKSEKWPAGWSYSSWGMFKKCLYLYYHARILGMKDTSPNIHMERGIKEHKTAEQYLKGNVTKLPKQFDSFRIDYTNLKRASPIVEQFWGVDPNWKPVNFNSWAVMKMDAAVAPSRITDGGLFIQDLKTGREYPDHIDQGEIYSAIGMALFPMAEFVEASFWYMDQGYAVTHTFDRAYIKFARRKWTERGRDVMSRRTKWPATPSRDNCKYCFLRADRGGPCKKFED